MLNNVIAQNTLDNLGLPSGTTASTAFSLRLLSTGYTGAAIQARRGSDDAIQDIGFTTSGDFDSVALSTFAGNDNVYITTWYDQSGNSRNMINTDVNYQPQILFSGAFKYIGSRITIDFSGNKGLVYTGSLSLVSVFTVIRSPSSNFPDFHTVLDGTPRIGGILENNGTTFHANVYPLAVWKDGIQTTVSASLSPVDQAMALSFDPINSVVYQIFVGNYDGGSNGGSIFENEIVTFSSVVTSGDRLNLVCNQGNYYSITTSCSTAIQTQPSNIAQAQCMDGTSTPLTVNASGINLTYQWYSNSVAANTNGTSINGATGSSFIPPANSVGTEYYYVEVSGSTGGTITSDVSGAITTDAPPTVSVFPVNLTIHAGDSITLTASGASSYLWGADNKTPLDHVQNFQLAVGLRQLRSSYTGPALRLRRATDNAESDFGFAGTALDIAAINTFLGASDGYCTTLYDQSGFGNNMVQTNDSQQPLFVADGLNGKPILHFSANGPQYMSNPTNFPPPYTVVYTAKQTGPSRGRVMTSIYNNWLLGWWNGSMDQAHFDGWVSPVAGTPSDTNAYVYSATGTGNNSFFYRNGTLLYNNNGGVSGPNGISINGNESSDADVAEIFAFNVSLAENDREIIENSTGSYYGVFGGAPVVGASLTTSPLTTTSYTVTGLSVNGGCAVSATSDITVLNDPGLTNFADQTKTYFDRSFTITPPATNNNAAFTYISSDTSVATINGTIVTIIGIGVTTIKAIAAANGNYFIDSISALLTVGSVSVVTKNGEISNTNYNFVNKYGALGAQGGLNENGESKRTLSSGDGSAANPSTSAFQIKKDYPASTDGLYWIRNPNINGGAAFQIYADMTTDGGGWTLILCNTSPNPGWDNNNALLRNQNSPDINTTYSIIAWADYIKQSSSGFQYMMDAQSRGSYGGIWTANSNYSFVSTSNGNTDITLNTTFGSWIYSDDDLEARMPWYSPGSQGLITTSNDANNSWWGTLIAAGGWSPAPWLGNSVQSPGIIWYWVR